MAWKKKKSQLMKENMLMRQVLEDIRKLNPEVASENGIEAMYAHSCLLGMAQGKADVVLNQIS